MVVLLRFRDERLLSDPAGQALVRLYYRLSPPIAEAIRQHESLRTTPRMSLTPVVYALAHPGATLVVMLAFLGIAMHWRRQRIAQRVSSKHLASGE